MKSAFLKFSFGNAGGSESASASAAGAAALTFFAFFAFFALAAWRAIPDGRDTLFDREARSREGGEVTNASIPSVRKEAASAAATNKKRIDGLGVVVVVSGRVAFFFAKLLGIPWWW